MRTQLKVLAIGVVAALLASQANAQEPAAASAWLDRLDREHNNIVSRAGHVHATGHVESVDVGPGTVTIWAREMQSSDKSIWMPAMRMVFHVTNRRMLKGLQPQDAVAFEAARLRNAVMITDIRKVRSR
jgi:Cu/Ag efflux protein CusF